MKNSNFAVFAVVGLAAAFLMCGGIALVGGIYWSKQVSRSRTFDDEMQLITVLVAAIDLPAGTVIKEPEKMLVFKPFTADTVPPNCFRNIEDLRGKVLARAVDRNMPLTVNDLSNVSDLFKSAPAGSRAVTIRVSQDTTASGFLFPGARVDIIGNIPDPENADTLVTKIFLQDIMVLAVAQDPSKPATGVLTVAVTAEEAEKLAAATQRGPLSVALRRPGE